jgi:hypothetical protein
VTPGLRHGVELGAHLVGPARPAPLQECGAHGIQDAAVAIGQTTAVALVDGEVALARVRPRGLDARQPFFAAGHPGERRGGDLPGAVVGDGEPRADRLAHALGGVVLARLEHGAVHQQGAPVEARGRDRRDHAVRDLVRDLDALRPHHAEQQRRLDRALGREALDVDHRDARAFGVGRLAAQQPAELRHVIAHELPGHRLLAQRAPRGEARAERADQPAGRQLLDAGDGGGRHQDVSEVRDEHRGAEPDALGGLGHARERDPHIAVQGGRVVGPQPLVAERLRPARVVHDVPTRREAARDPHGPQSYPMPRSR